MEIAAFAVGCLAVMLASLSLGWQVYSWRRDRRFSVTVEIREEGVAFGTRRYPIWAVVTNDGGTTEWVEQISLHATYDREQNRRMYFNSPELVRNPSMNRELPPRKRFESEFNLLSGHIGAGGLPLDIVAVATFASGHEARSQVFLPDAIQARAAREPDPVADIEIPKGLFEDYFPIGPFALCRDCKSEIPVDANVCRFCGYRIKEPLEGRTS